MNRLQSLFNSKKNILSIYFTAGYPQLNDTEATVKHLADAGVDMIEVGFPFSDPLADGPVIQQSSVEALKNGISTKIILNQLKDIRQKTQVPLVMMGYLNPILQFGMENFLQAIAEIGFDGVILPDLPLDVYEKEYKVLFKKYQIPLIFLITPQTSEDRIRYIDSISDSFIYMVSSASTTGKTTGISSETVQYFDRIQKMHLNSPLMIGFGISNKETFELACKYANGAIVGSAFIKALSPGKLNKEVKSFVDSILS